MTTAAVLAAALAFWPADAKLAYQTSEKLVERHTPRDAGTIPGRLAARFIFDAANASGLESLGNNCYGQTLNSGTFNGIGVDVSADGSSMNTGQLEMSNVDLSQEFTEMITTQRGFQANSRIITVSDTMLEELTNLKR